MTIGLEHQFVVSRLCRFEQEHLDERTRFLAEMHSRLNHPGVIEHHKSTLGQMRRDIIEDILTDVSMVEDEQFGMIALCQREFCNSLVGQRIVIIRYMYMSWIHNQ